MVSPDLTRDMAGVPEISGVQERERDVEHPEGMSSPQGSTVPVGNPVPRDGSELRPSARISRKERDHNSACVEDLPREDLVPVVDGSWRFSGAEEISCELKREWCFLGSGVLVKQLRSWRKGMGVERERESGMVWGRPGEQGQCWECTLIQVMAPNVRKTLLTKKAHEKSLTSIEQFNSSFKLPGWPGKRWHSSESGPGMVL
jgi:hypothetical protein